MSYITKNRGLPFPFSLTLYTGLYPADPLEAAYADAAVDAVGDNHVELRPTLLEKDEKKMVY